MLTDEQLAQLRAQDGKALEITCIDGEVVRGKLVTLPGERDVLCDFASTNRPEKYVPQPKLCLLIHPEDIVRFEQVSDGHEPSPRNP